MQQFRISSEGINDLRKKLRLRMMMLALTFMAVFNGIGFFNGSFSDTRQAAIFVGLGVLILVIISFRFYGVVKKQIRKFESYVLTLDGNILTREMMNTEEVSVYQHEVKSIERNHMGGLTIKGMDHDVIYVPKLIERKEEVEQLLSQFKPITVPGKAKSVLQKLTPVLSILMVALVAGIYGSDNKIIVGLSAAGLIALMTYSIYTIRTNKSVELQAKRNIWIFVFVTIMILIVAILKLTDNYL